MKPRAALAQTFLTGKRPAQGAVLRLSKNRFAKFFDIFGSGLRAGFAILLR